MISILDLLGTSRWFILIIALVIAGAVESKKFSGAFLWFVIGIFLMYASYIMPYVPFLPNYTAEILAYLGIILLIGFPKWLLYSVIAIGVIGLGVKLFAVVSAAISLIIIAVIAVGVILFLGKRSIKSYLLYRKHRFSY